MEKHPRKRQRIADDDVTETPFLGGDTDKDEEERRLESILFGKAFVPTAKDKPGAALGSNERYEAENDAGGGLGNLLDSDLFYFDDAGGSANLEQPEEMAPRAPNSHRRKPTIWADPDDENIHVSLADDKRLRKLRDAPQENVVGGRDYESRLRRQYEKIHPVPQWATNARQQLRKSKRRHASHSSESGNSDTEGAMSSLLSSSGALLSSSKVKTLPNGLLSVERLRDANQAANADGEVKSVMFYPSPSVPVLLSASADRRLRLFNIDGHTNPHLQTVHIPTLPITTAIFHPSGSSVLLTGRKPFYYTYDLKAGTCMRSPRGLWGSFASNANNADLGMETCAFSNTGNVLAVAGRQDYIHLVDWRTGGAQVVGSVKMNTTVKDIYWTREGKLMSLSEDSEVYLWDIGERKCLKRWTDDGGYGSVVMTGGKSGAYLAIGAKTGLVNIYGSESMATDASGIPKPVKTIGNLTTSVSTMRFNHDSQILALASKAKKDQFKMVHLPSTTVFSNWPTSTTPLGHITSVDFSMDSSYVALGNNRGRVLLYSLKHFASA